MRLFIFIAFFITLSNTLFANPFNLENSLTLTHINDINLLGETSGATTGDDRLTGVLDIAYLSDENLYTMRLDSYTQRHLTAGERVDTLTFGYLRNIVAVQTDSSYYGVMVGIGAIGSGNYGGEVLQNAIHTLTRNPHYDLPFSTQKAYAIGFRAKGYATYLLNEDVSLYTHLDIAQNSDKSGSVLWEIGGEYRYGEMALWIAGVANLIEPFDHPVVVYSVPDKGVLYGAIGASFTWNQHYQIILETTWGGTALGERDDYSSALGLRYFL